MSKLPFEMGPENNQGPWGERPRRQVNPAGNTSVIQSWVSAIISTIVWLLNSLSNGLALFCVWNWFVAPFLGAHAFGSFWQAYCVGFVSSYLQIFMMSPPHPDYKPQRWTAEALMLVKALSMLLLTSMAWSFHTMFQIGLIH